LQHTSLNPYLRSFPQNLKLYSDSQGDTPLQHPCRRYRPEQQYIHYSQRQWPPVLIRHAIRLEI